MDSFSYLEPVCCSMSSSNCCFLTCIQISQEADQVVWYSHLLKSFPQLIVIHTVKGFGIVNKAEIDVFLELSCSCQIDRGKKWKQWQTLFSWASKSTADGNCSHKSKRLLLLGRKTITYLDSALKIRNFPQQSSLLLLFQ